MELVSHTQKNEESPTSVFYTYDDFFPSVNAAYRLNDKHQFRLSYGRTVNRPEFRKITPYITSTQEIIAFVIIAPIHLFQ